MTTTLAKDRIYTKSVHIFPSKKTNCGVIPDKNGLIFHFGETKETYPPKYIKVVVSNDIEKLDIAKSLRKLADILEEKEFVEYEENFKAGKK